MRIGDALSKKITCFCKDENISINQFANMCCLTQSTVQHIVEGKSKNPKMLTIIRICDGIGIPLYKFFQDDLFIDLDRED